VVNLIKGLVLDFDARLTVDERNLLSIAYKNITNVLRNSWRVADTLEKLEGSRPNPVSRHAALARRQRERIERELANACKDLVDLLDGRVLLLAQTGEETVFYLKM
jgi:14-3-3 protein epsilon